MPVNPRRPPIPTSTPPPTNRLRLSCMPSGDALLLIFIPLADRRTAVPKAPSPADMVDCPANCPANCPASTLWSSSVHDGMPYMACKTGRMSLRDTLVIPPVVLIGPVGVGKSTIAGLLAARMGWPHVSMDAVCSGYYAEV